jgi:hypothetical protein
MRKTLQALVTQMGLSLDQKFTPELQDKMAIQLLKNRGLDRYLAGNMTDEDFALSLSKEWASMPNPKTGRSYYAGDGLNKSLVSVPQFLEAIRRVKEAPPEVLATPIAPTPLDPTPGAPEPRRVGFWSSLLSILLHPKNVS